MKIYVFYLFIFFRTKKPHVMIFYEIQQKKPDAIIKYNNEISSDERDMKQISRIRTVDW